MADFTITIDSQGNLNPNKLDCKLNDHITWVNDLTEDDIIDLPACVTPQDGSVTILPNGGKSKQYTASKKGTWGYKHHHKHHKKLNGTSGTIDVS